MTFSATIFNIDFTGTQTLDPNDNLVAAHIHAAPTVTPTTNAGVVWGFFGSPFNDNNPNDVVIAPFTNGVGGTISGKWDAPEVRLSLSRSEYSDQDTPTSASRLSGGGEIAARSSSLLELRRAELSRRALGVAYQRLTPAEGLRPMSGR
jgi:hypothetical protein